MVRLQHSFLLRWWVLDGGGTRIELLHIQSGARVVVSSPTEALDWMGRGADPAGDAGGEARDDLQRGGRTVEPSN
ncbi:MAG TPA: hypothetical protein VFI42_09420 [Thermomicrobiaceae bacterium]|nr:hypothetical protein [Thermomicrobiaceae bacterium]